MESCLVEFGKPLLTAYLTKKIAERAQIPRRQVALASGVWLGSLLAGFPELRSNFFLIRCNRSGSWLVPSWLGSLLCGQNSFLPVRRSRSESWLVFRAGSSRATRSP